MLGVWVVYPAVYTIVRSFFGQKGYLGTWVGIDNYRSLFTTSALMTAIKNNALWVAVVPALVTSVGLIFAVLTERIRWSVAFKTVVFLPMAISAFATGVTWRIMYQQDPSRARSTRSAGSLPTSFSPPGRALRARARRRPRCRRRAAGARAQDAAPTGRRRAARPDGDRRRPGPEEREAGRPPPAKPGDIVGVVWRDFKPGGGKPGVVEKQELGLPGVTVQLRDAAGKTVQSTTTSDRRRRSPSRTSRPGTYHAGDRRADVREAVRRLSPGSARS